MYKHSRFKAFTLIELLVVIAIIAILAAILFPVFAQAKAAAKKAAAISQAKQTGTAILIYTADVDDLFPCGMIPDLTSATQPAWRTTAFTALVPAGWATGAALPATAAIEHSLVWANSTFPYTKNYDILNHPATVISDIAGLTPVAGAFPRPVNLSMNGLLQFSSTTAVVAPSSLTMLWPGLGNQSNRGAVVCSPILACRLPGECRFTPGVHPQGQTGNPQIYTFNFTTSWWAFGQGSVHVFTDSSAKLVNYGRGNAAGFPTSTTSPVTWQFLNASGQIPASPGAFFRGMGTNAAAGRTANWAASFALDNTFTGRF